MRRLVAGLGLAMGIGLVALALLPALPDIRAGGASVLTAGQQPGVLTRIDGTPLSPRFPARDADYAPPVGFTRTIAATGMVWHTLPQPPQSDRPAAIVLLHGSGRDGRAMVDMWQGMAADHDILLIAPDAADPQAWSMRDEPAAALMALLDDVALTHPFDPDRVYLYGHSAGANHALALAPDGPWRAVAVHAGDIGTVQPTGPAPIPVRIQIGTDDLSYPLDVVTQAAERLAEAGHDVDLLVIPGHDHWFYDIGPRLAADAWSFFDHPGAQAD
ncbi:Predicted esterase [Loktanella fryxellensis]|uniref:Predicted esterase n=1 Tax=Loktanella fryxellensis TaxID=245187 RepID=A0A1H8FYE2_9RHOB|nr:hypothetical protein [Loktanella fryxellensis]SEN36118.1 Predicted esterase [Loktanella fryxellensis]